MSSDIPIHDLYFKRIYPATVQGVTSWVPLRDNDHLLRRFGQIEVVQIGRTASPICRVREVADDVWALIEGSVDLRFKDFRSISPSQGETYSSHADEPFLALVPFGVGFGVGALEEGTLLIRMSTHEDGTHPGDQILAWGDLE